MLTQYPAQDSIAKTPKSELTASASLSALVSAILKKVECKSVVDVSSGDGEVVQALRHRRMNCSGLGLRANPLLAIEAFDLSSAESEANIAHCKDALPYSVRPSLLTCLNTLQLIDREQLSKALWNLRSMCTDWFLVSADSQPAANDRAYHATVLPPTTWLKLFSILGFARQEIRELELLARPIVDTSDPAAWPVGHWRQLDPYRDQQAGKGNIFLLRKECNKEIDFERFHAEATRILGRSEVENPPALDANTFLTFLIGHYQGFLLFESLFNSLPKNSFRVLLRSGPFDVIEKNRRQAMLSFFAARNIRVEFLDSIETIDWEPSSEKRNHAWVTAIDSTATRSHLINSAFLAIARERRIPTFQLQHGIWPHAEFPKSHTVLADYLLTWSPDFEKPFELDSQSTDTQGHSFSTRHLVYQVGCPRFDGYRDGRTATVAELFGDWTSRFQRSVLVATNLHWPLHAKGNQVLPQLAATAREMPETLFVCKLHPVHDFDPLAFEQMPENVLVVDEFVSLYADLSTPRLVKACDAVVCTLSTVALEAALAKKPLLLLDTENPNVYTGLACSAISSLTKSLQDQFCNPLPDYTQFLDAYYKPEQEVAALERTLKLIDSSFSRAEFHKTSADIATTALAKAFLSEVESTHRRSEENDRLIHELCQANHCPTQSTRAMRRQPESSATTGKTISMSPSTVHRLRTFSKVRREVLRVFNQVTGAPRSRLTARVAATPASAQDFGGPVTHVPSQSLAPCIASPAVPTKVGELTNRDQFPQLLNELGLDGLAIELGVASAGFSDHILQHSNTKLLFSVDRWSDHHNDEECDFARDVLSKHGIRSAILRMTFEEAVQIFADETFDFIYIDGYAHTGQDGVHTLDAWWPKLKQHGIFGGHDYHASWPKTMDVVDQFIAKHHLTLHTTQESPTVEEHAYPSWYTVKHS